MGRLIPLTHSQAFHKVRRSCRTVNIQIPTRGGVAFAASYQSTPKLLVVYPRQDSYEVEHAERTSADGFINHQVGYGLPAKTEPMCFMGKINLMAILQDEGDAKLVEAIIADRKCDAWYPYMPGLSPKEHYEEYQMQRLEQDRREFERKLSDMALQAHQTNATILESQLKTVSDLKEVATQTDRFQRRVTWWIIILALAQVLIAMAIYLFPHESYTDQLLRKLFG